MPRTLTGLADLVGPPGREHAAAKTETATSEVTTQVWTARLRLPFSAGSNRSQSCIVNRIRLHPRIVQRRVFAIDPVAARKPGCGHGASSGGDLMLFRTGESCGAFDGPSNVSSVVAFAKGSSRKIARESGYASIDIGNGLVSPPDIPGSGCPPTPDSCGWLPHLLELESGAPMRHGHVPASTCAGSFR